MQVSSYSPAVRDLLKADRLMVLGPGVPDEAVREKLEVLMVDTLFAPATVRRTDFAKGCLAGLWLYHDFLDKSHSFSQSISTPEGSYWHGIVHRREPDFANSKYWFRHVGRHPVFAAVRAAAAALAAEEPHRSAAFLATQSEWDPFAFIDLCQACVTGPCPCELLCRRVQQREWEILFDHCYREALGAQA